MTDAAPDPTDEPLDDPLPARRESLELDRAQEFLDRTAAFLERCTEDSKAAFAADDPDELRAGLEDLGPRPRRAADDDEPPVERRRSA